MRCGVNGSLVKSIGCFSKDSGFNSQHPPPYAVPVSGLLIPSSGFHSYCTHKVHTYMQAKHLYTSAKKLFFLSHNWPKHLGTSNSNHIPKFYICKYNFKCSIKTLIYFFDPVKTVNVIHLPCSTLVIKKTIINHLSSPTILIIIVSQFFQTILSPFPQCLQLKRSVE